MDFLKKARSQATVVVKDVKNVAQQMQQQYNARNQSQGHYPQQQYGNYNQPQSQYLSQQQYSAHHQVPAQNVAWQQPQQQQQQQQLPVNAHQNAYAQNQVPYQQYPPPQHPYSGLGNVQQQQQPAPALHSQQMYSLPPQQAGPGNVQQQSAYSSHQMYAPPPQQTHQLQQPTLNHQHQREVQISPHAYQSAAASEFPPPPAQATYPSTPSYQEQMQSPNVVQPRTMSIVPTNSCAATDSKLTDYVQFYVLEPALLKQPGRSDLPETVLTICHHCFRTEVSLHHDIAMRFVPLQSARNPSQNPHEQISHQEAVCDLSFPTIRQIFYSQCVPQRSIGALLEHAALLNSMPRCTGADAGNNSDYYRLKDMNEFAFCPACFEQHIKRTTFEHGFERCEGTPNWTWTCDVAIRGMIYRSLMAEMQSSHPDINRFRSKVLEYFALAKCPGEGNAIAPEGSTEPSFAYCAVGGRLGNFCPTCFHDYIAGTNMEKYFNNYVQLEQKDLGSVVCDLASRYSKFAMKVAIQKGGDYDTWIKPLPLLNTLPNCPQLKGVDEEELQSNPQQWYFYREFPCVEICPRCYHTAVELYGAAHYFAPIDRPLRNGFIRVCYLTVTKEANADPGNPSSFENSLAWRGMVFRNALSHGWLANDGEFKGFRIFAKSCANLPPPCTGQERSLKAVNGRRWVGRFKDDPNDPNDVILAMCEECWGNNVKGTALESMLSQDMTASANKLAEGFHCNVYSKKAKSMLSEACQRGDWQYFVRYWHERNEVRSRYDELSERFKQQIELRNREQQMQIDIQTQQAAIGLMQQLNANQNAIIAGVGGSVSTAANSTYNYSYGNSTIGYHATPGGANAAQAWHNAANMPKPSLANFQSTGNVFQDTENMLQIYNRVRAEWLAIE